MSPTLPPPSTELGILCLILKVFLKTASPNDLAQHLSATPPDSAQLMRLLNVHRVIPVTYLTLKQSGLLTAFSKDFQRELTSHYHQLARRNLQLTAETLKLLEQFQQAGIRVLPLKGSLLSQQAYGSFTHRMPGDIDLLVEPGAYCDATNLLEKLGYYFSKAGAEWTTIQQEFYAQQGGEISYVNSEKSIEIDLHVRWSRNPHFFTLSFDQAWQQASYLTIADSKIPVLCLNHQMLYLSSHGAKHYWERLAWLLDIAQLVQSNTAVDINGLVDHAQALGIQHPLQQTLQLLEQWFSFTSLPTTVSQSPKESSKWLTVAASNKILDSQRLATVDRYKVVPTPQSMWSTLEYRLRLNSNFTYKKTCLTRLLISSRDWQLLSLPKPLWFLYIFLRPFLYIWRLQRQ